MKNWSIGIISLVGVLVISTCFMDMQDNGDWVAPAEANNLKNPYAGNKSNAKAENHYIVNCERCHGSYGKGDGIDGTKLKPKPADLTSEKTQKQTDGAIFWKITTGRGAMDSYRNILEENERWQLVNYIRVLGKNQNAVSR